MKARPVASDATLSQIDFLDGLAVVAERCVSAPGRARLLARRPAAELEAVREELALVAELIGIMRDGDRFRPVPVDDIAAELRELQVDGSVLDAPGLMALGRALDAMRQVHAELRRVDPTAPRVGRLNTDVPPAEIGDRIGRAFDPDGSIRDDASDDLKRARRTVRATRKKLVAFLEKTLRSAGGRDGADGNVTMRNGRYVIPVRREAKSPIRGIVHAESSSGATVFVEPDGAVGLGNELAAAEAAERRAELAVLRDLTERARAVHEAISAGWDMCVAVDDVHARARYAIETEGVVPDMQAAPCAIRIVGGRHPLLLAELDMVVPFELDTGAEDRVVLISGPNTGGKTVLLKGVGLFCALAQSGVIPPVRARTVLPVFRTIVSDIGDHQSIADSLSTYGGHLTAARELLELVDQRALVLIDELGTGTDPAEGAALAGALLRSLCARGCFTMATTHLGQLKRIAADTDGVLNASLKFDPEKLEPTYHFQLGVPGRSYGLALARRLGLPAELLAEAESLRSETERSLESLLADLELRQKDLETRERAVAETTERLHAERDGLDVLKERLDAERSELRGIRQEQEVNGREEARRYLLEARKRVEEALGMARGAVNETTAREARQLVEGGVQKEASALEKLAEQAEKKGWTVRVGSSGRKKKPAARTAAVAREAAPRIVRRAAPLAPETDARSEINLRGMTGDEAELVLLRALDDAVVEGLPVLRIIHGKGTGALRERVRVVLKQDKRVRSAETASAFEGGWGVTIAELAG